jgi:energy-coupling factor transport system substrate-specific component
MKNTSIKTVVAIGIGAALFFVLGRFVAIPSGVPNTNISLQYAVLGLLAAMYGPLAGGLIGFIGHTLIDLSWGGSPWWSWVIASAFVGVVVGLFPVTGITLPFISYGGSSLVVMMSAMGLLIAVANQ